MLYVKTQMYQEEPAMLMIRCSGAYITNDVLRLFPKNLKKFLFHSTYIEFSTVMSNEKNKMQSIYLRKPLKSKVIC